MTTFNANLFDHINIPHDPPRQNPLAHQVTVLPLNLIALIISHLDRVADLARVCQTSRVLHYMTLPQLYRNISLTSYSTIHYKNDQPEGQGSASPFAMGLNALVSRNVASLVHSLSLEGDWREHDLQEFSNVGRVPDNAMMLNIAVRAAVDRCTQLQEFKWDLSSKLLSTVYYGLINLQHLKSFHLRFPNTRSPRPTTAIPPMPNLEHFIMTHYDPLCFPDDVSLLLLHASKLKTLILHFSPRMRDAGEPSVQITNLFRRNIAAQRPLRPTKIGLYNLFAEQHGAELMNALDPTALRDVTFINTFGQDEDTSQSGPSPTAGGMFSFFDQTWIDPPKEVVYIRSERHDRVHKRHVQMLQRFTGMERVYLVNARHNPNPIPIEVNGINGVHGINGINDTNDVNGINGTNSTTNHPRSTSPPSTSSPSTTPSGRTPPNPPNISLRDRYLSAICLNHGSTLRHLIFPSRWPLSPSQTAKLFTACPRLTQLSMGMDTKALPQLRLLFPLLKHLWAMRLVDVAGEEEVRRGGKCEIADAMHEGVMGMELAAVGEFLELRYLGINDKVWEVGGVFEEMGMLRVESEGQGGELEFREEMLRKRRLKKISLQEVRDVEIWKMDSQDVV